MAPPDKYRYDPDQQAGPPGGFVNDFLTGQGRFTPPWKGDYWRAPEGDSKRRELQATAMSIIEAQLSEAERASADMQKLVPSVMAAVDEAQSMDPSAGAKFIKQVEATIAAPFLDARKQTQSGIIGRLGGATAAATGTSQPASGGARKTQAEQVADLRNLVLAAADTSVNGKTPEERAAAETSLLSLTSLYKQVANLADGQVTLDDNTIITTAMLNNSDPVVAQQYQQAFADKQSKIDNNFAQVMNAYNVEGYGLARQSINDKNSTAISQYNAQIANIRERLSRDQIDITRASTEINRALQGLQESRSRTELETKTQLEAAPWATTDGKTEFTPRDIGQTAINSAIRRGVSPDAPTLRFPGTITLDPSAGMARRDAELGVTGALPTVPGLTVQASEIPSAPQLTNPGSIQLPERIAPKPRNVITMPTTQGAWRGYDASGMNP